MIPTEDNYVEWILFGIKDYFRRMDYRVLTYSIGQIKERQCPVDRILAIGNKIIGLQFKRPSKQGPDWRYEVIPHQHKMISQARWIYYCVPDFVDFRMQEVALHHCRFIPGNDLSLKIITNSTKYFRWGPLASGMVGCWEGLEIGTKFQIEQLIIDMTDNPRDTYLALNKQA